MEFPHIPDLVIIWGAILLLVFIVSLFRYLSRRSHYRLLETLAEKGQSLTPEMLSNLGGNGKSSDQRSPIGGGIFLMCIGVALGVFFWAMEGQGVPGFLPFIGIFPFMIGLARVLGAAFDRPRDK
jgi:hypothetical protein